MNARTLLYTLTVAAILCLLFAFLPVFPALSVGRDALFVGAAVLLLAVAGLVHVP
jgi:hypothetical protein